MRIETFNALLKAVKPAAIAYVPNGFEGNRKTVVSIVYTAGGKVYDYKGTILAIAQRLDLIPVYDIEREARLALNELKNGREYTTTNTAYDTIRHNAIALGFDVDYTNRTTDEFGRTVVTFYRIP